MNNLEIVQLSDNRQLDHSFCNKNGQEMKEIMNTQYKYTSCELQINKTYPPALQSPTPPGHARTKLGSASKETGLNVPVWK